jgi:hypothetical protein
MRACPAFAVRGDFVYAAIAESDRANSRRVGYRDDKRRALLRAAGRRGDFGDVQSADGAKRIVADD